MVAVDHICVLPQRGQLRGDIRILRILDLQMLQRYCKPWQASCFLHRANELCKRTGEKLDWGKDYRNHQAETHCKNAGVSRFGAVDKLGNLDFSLGIWYNKRKTSVNVC